jgi:flagellar biosynthesis protein FlhG
MIVDADIGMANIDVMMGCIARYSLLDIIDGSKSFEDVVVTGPRNIKFLPGGSGIRTLHSLTNIELQRLLSQAVQLEKSLDFILFDTGAGMGDNVMSFLMAADDILLITTPEPTSLTDAYAIIKAYSSNSGCAPLKLVVNRAQDGREGSVVADKLCKAANRFLNIDLQKLGYILEDAAISSSIRLQNPLLVQFPNSPAAGCIVNIAHRLAFTQTDVLPQEQAEKSGFSGFFKKFLKISKK